MTDSKGIVWSLLLVAPSLLRTVGSGTWLDRAISRQKVATCHRELRSLHFVDIRVGRVVGARSRGLLQILMEAAGLASASQGETRSLALTALHGRSQLGWQGVRIGSRSIVTPTVTVPHAKAVTWSQELTAWSTAFRAVCTRPGGLEAKPLLLAAVQAVVGSAILAIAVDLRVRVVAGTGRAVIPVLSVADTEGVGRTLCIHAAGVMFTLTNQPRKGVAGARAAIHSSDGAARLGI